MTDDSIKDMMNTLIENTRLLTEEILEIRKYIEGYQKSDSVNPSDADRKLGFYRKREYPKEWGMRKSDDD